jgi:N-acetylmuramoyl-L-alanine amidase
MCDACEHPPRTVETPARTSVDRRTLLRRAGLGGAAAAAAFYLPDAHADALGPPFESLQVGEDLRPGMAAALQAAALPAAPVLSRRKKRTSAAGFGAPHIVTRAEWGADESIRTTARGFAPIRKFVVHHTASRNNPRDPTQVMRDMYRYHVVGRGFSDVGYNFAIDQHGTIYEARWARHYDDGELHDGESHDGFGVVGAHALGVNAGSCGIVLIGDFTKRRPTQAAMSSLIQLISWKAALHHVDPLRTEEYISIFGVHRRFANIAGHRQTGNTVCPGGYLFKQLPAVRNEVARRVGRFPSKTIDMSKALRWTSTSSVSSSAATVSTASVNAAAGVRGAKLTGYRLLTHDGRVITLGKARKLGSPRDHGLAAGRAIAGVPGRNSYLTSDPSGRVVGFGGPVGGSPRTSIQAADIASTPSGKGYWVLTPMGGIYAFGRARHHGSLARSGIGVGGVKIRSTPSGAGYWILGGDGRVYAFGDATRLRSAVSSGAVDFWPTPGGEGHWILTAGGRVGAFGDADHFGDVPDLGVRWTEPAVAIIGMPSGRGYAIASSDGGMFNFGSSPFLGSLGGSGRHVVGLALAFG